MKKRSKIISQEANYKGSHFAVTFALILDCLPSSFFPFLSPTILHSFPYTSFNPFCIPSFLAACSSHGSVFITENFPEAGSIN